MWMEYCNAYKVVAYFWMCVDGVCVGVPRLNVVCASGNCSWRRYLGRRSARLSSYYLILSVYLMVLVYIVEYII